MNVTRAGVAALMAVAFWSAAASGRSTIVYSGRQGISSQLLAMHNAERARMRAAPLQWDPQLAAAAASYGATLARIGRLQHAPRSLRAGQGENLWMGTRGAFTPAQMVGTWIAERIYFRPGPFPNVSKTGNWADVGHYTQMISKGTTRVGCAIYPSAQWEFLVCRYSPPGNIDGRLMP